MSSEIKAASDTHLHQHKSFPLPFFPLGFLSSKNSNNLSRNKILHHSSMESINDNYQRFSNQNLINTHLPIANIQRNSMIINKTSSSQLPTVPKQAGAFIHRLVKKLFSITNINENNNKESLHRKPIRRKQLNTRILSDNSDNILSNQPLRSKTRKRQCSKITTDKHCVVCRRHRNCLAILPMNKIQSGPKDSIEYTSQSPMIFNTNATPQNISFLNTEPVVSLAKIRSLNESQCQTISSAVEVIFDTLISNYQ